MLQKLTRALEGREAMSVDSLESPSEVIVRPTLKNIGISQRNLRRITLENIVHFIDIC